MYYRFVYTDANDFSNSIAMKQALINVQPTDLTKAFALWALQDNKDEPLECLNLELTTSDPFVFIPDERRIVRICIEDTNSEFLCCVNIFSSM